MYLKQSLFSGKAGGSLDAPMSDLHKRPVLAISYQAKAGRRRAGINTQYHQDAHPLFPDFDAGLSRSFEREPGCFRQMIERAPR